jgi:hypothetical protein
MRFCGVSTAFVASSGAGPLSKSIGRGDPHTTFATGEESRFLADGEASRSMVDSLCDFGLETPLSKGVNFFVSFEGKDSLASLRCETLPSRGTDDDTESGTLSVPD